ncbi:ATP-binding protein [Derxia gummosa]|uniref:Virulence sensor protein BvgS n=1 Tax=Derxia gummosa DSM 723 TaxID=1121388 RepID=A0A8B6XAK2_9BURK|nr:ATP-binding protein [Derxia gummosa]
MTKNPPRLPPHPPIEARLRAELLSSGLQQARASSASFAASRLAIAAIGLLNGIVVESLMVAIATLAVVVHRVHLLKRFPPIGIDPAEQRPVVRTMELNCALNSAISLFAVATIERHVPMQQGMLILVILAVSLTVAGQYTALIGRCFVIYMIPHLLAIGLAGLLGPPVLLVVAATLLPMLFFTLRRSSTQFREMVENSIRQRMELVDANAALTEARDGAEAASRAKSQFLASMSHEIRTPLNGVLGTLDMLRRSRLDPKQRHMVETAASSSDQLLHVLNEVLDLSKIEAGRMEIEPVPVVPGAIAQAAVNLFNASARSRQIELRCEAAPDLPRLVLLDPARTRQVLLNLIGNAIKFTERGGVTVRVRRLSDGPDRLDRLRFEVADTGIGMTPDALGRLFEPFTQVDQSNRRRHGGSGLGLAISRRLAEAMAGSLDAISTAGIGSTFRFDLPLVEPDPLAWAHCPPPAPSPATAASPAPSPAGFVGLPGGADEAGYPQTNIGATQFGPLDFGPSRFVPLGDEPADSATGPADPGTLPPALRPARVLLVEDNVVNRLLASTMLEQLGLDVTEAEDGETGCELARRERYDLVLMDCQMPGMDGFATTAGIREDEHRRGMTRVPIVALTASAMPGDADACLRAGMDGYLSKPYTLDQLRAVLAPWLGAEPSALRA